MRRVESLKTNCTQNDASLSLADEALKEMEEHILTCTSYMETTIVLITSYNPSRRHVSSYFAIP